MKPTDDEIQQEYRDRVKELQGRVPQSDKDRMAQLQTAYRYRIPPEYRRFACLDDPESLNVWLSMSCSERDAWFEKVEKYALRISD